MLLKIWLLLFCCLLTGGLQAQEQDTMELRTIAVSPYGIEDKHSPHGFYYELLAGIARDAGYRFNHYIYPYARIVRELKSGQADITIMFKYEELEQHVHYIAPLTPLKVVVIGRQGVTFESIASLRGKSIAYLRGARFSPAIDNDPQINRLQTTDFYQSVKMLARGRVDAIIGPMQPILSAASDLGKTDDFFGPPLLVTERTPWLQSSKHSRHQISPAKISAAFDRAREQGRLQRLRTKYLFDEIQAQSPAYPANTGHKQTPVKIDN